MSATRAAFVSLAALAALAALAGCADEVPIALAPCPCTSGYICCATQVCVAAGDVCPLDPWKLDDPVVEPMLVAIGVDLGACRTTATQRGVIASWDILRKDGGFDLLLHNPDGWPIRLDSVQIDGGGRITGATLGDDVLVHQYLFDGRLQRSARTSPTQGNASWQYGYRQDGSWTVEAIDPQFLGADELRIHRPDALGRDALVEIETRNQATGRFGDVVATITTTFDARGPLVRDFDRDQFGVQVTETFLYDALGRSLGMDRQYEADPMTYHPYVILRDDRGRVRRREYHASLVGLGDVSFDYEYTCD
jgi:hypothetical protein